MHYFMVSASAFGDSKWMNRIKQILLFLLPLLLPLSCPSVATLDTAEIGTKDSLGYYPVDLCITTGITQDSLFPIVLWGTNFRFQQTLINKFVECGIYTGTSGALPFLKVGLQKPPIALGVRGGFGGFGAADLIIFNWFGDAWVSARVGKKQDLYGGVKTFGFVGCGGPDTIPEESSSSYFRLLGGFVGYRINRLGLEFGLYRILDDENGMLVKKFGRYLPVVAFSIPMKFP